MISFRHSIETSKPLQAYLSDRKKTKPFAHYCNQIILRGNFSRSFPEAPGIHWIKSFHFLKSRLHQPVSVYFESACKEAKLWPTCPNRRVRSPGSNNLVSSFTVYHFLCQMFSKCSHLYDLIYMMVLFMVSIELLWRPSLKQSSSHRQWLVQFCIPQIRIDDRCAASSLCASISAEFAFGVVNFSRCFLFSLLSAHIEVLFCLQNNRIAPGQLFARNQPELEAPNFGAPKVDEWKVHQRFAFKGVLCFAGFAVCISVLD